MRAAWLLVGTGCSGALALACSSSGSECGNSDCSPPIGGYANGGSPSALGGTNSGGKSSAGSVGVGGTSAASVDCAAVCAHVKALCPDNAAISDVWLDVCESACDARVQVAPDTAALEQTCVMAAPDCSEAVNCVASPH